MIKWLKIGGNVLLWLLGGFFLFSIFIYFPHRVCWLMLLLALCVLPLGRLRELRRRLLPRLWLRALAFLLIFLLTVAALPELSTGSMSASGPKEGSGISAPAEG